MYDAAPETVTATRIWRSCKEHRRARFLVAFRLTVHPRCSSLEQTFGSLTSSLQRFVAADLGRRDLTLLDRLGSTRPKGIMPTVHKVPGPYRLFFYSFDCNEPKHVHVRRERMVCKKFWLEPVISFNESFSPAEPEPGSSVDFRAPTKDLRGLE